MLIAEKSGTNWLYLEKHKIGQKNSVGTVQAAALKKKLLLGTAIKRDIEKYNVLRR